MSATVRFWGYAGGLGAVVLGAVVSVAAQVPPAPPAPPTPPVAPVPPSAEARTFTMLEGRGSRLGVMVQDLDAADGGAGIRIDRVEPDSPAERAGLRTGDIVVEYDGERVRSARQFTRLVQETPEGRAVPLAVLRDGQRESLTATPEARAFSWNMDLDADRIRREVERGMEGLRGFRLDGAPGMRFHFEGVPGIGAPGRGRLGVQVDSLDGQLAEYFGAPDGGALVTRVEPESPAARAGLKAGDVITEVDGQAVRDAGQLATLVGRATDDTLRLDYLRDRTAATATVTLAPAAPRREPGERRRPVRPARLMRPA